jgi:hypothetical protein
MDLDLNTLPSLSAAIVEFDKVLETLTEQISSLSITPYELQKAMLFNKDHKFPKIHEIKVPENITNEGLIETISEIEKRHQRVAIDALVNPDNYNIVDSDKEVSILAELSGSNTYVVTEQKLKNYFEYLELIHSIDIESVTNENSRDIIRKLGFFYVNAVNQKTV